MGMHAPEVGRHLAGEADLVDERVDLITDKALGALVVEEVAVVRDRLRSERMVHLMRGGMCTQALLGWSSARLRACFFLTAFFLAFFLAPMSMDDAAERDRLCARTIPEAGGAKAEHLWHGKEKREHMKCRAQR